LFLFILLQFYIDLQICIFIFIFIFKGKIFYYKNTGTSTNPIYTQQVGSANPLNNVDVGDVIKGCSVGGVANTMGSTACAAASGVYKTKPTDCGIDYDANNNINKCGFAKPRAVDIDNDGDIDMFIGNGKSINYPLVVC